MNTDNTISVLTIQQTETYKGLGKINEKNPLLNKKLHAELLIRRESRKQLTHALIMLRSTGIIDTTLNQYQLGVLKELALIENLKFEE